MFARTKALSASIFAVVALSAGALAPSAAAQNQDGLVNVMIGDISILNDANIGDAAHVAANVCGVRVGPVAVLAQQVDQSGAQQTVCGTGDQAVRLVQN
jgi:hypothetical protein